MYLRQFDLMISVEVQCQQISLPKQHYQEQCWNQTSPLDSRLQWKAQVSPGRWYLAPFKQFSTAHRIFILYKQKTEINTEFTDSHFQTVTVTECMADIHFQKNLMALKRIQELRKGWATLNWTQRPWKGPCFPENGSKWSSANYRSSMTEIVKV